MRRWLIAVTGAVIAVPVLWFLAGLIGGRLAAGPDWPQQGLTIGLMRGPIHDDVVLPLDTDTCADFAFAERDKGLPVSHPAAEWVLVGWGSRAFYTRTGT